tara:strand:- start:106 stop:765 length:660 start_codon:yes stop_codon:yes gene_type:complete
MALEDKFKDELIDIGILGSFASNLNTIKDVDKREQIYRTAAMIICGRDDPERGKEFYREFITKNPEGVNSLINSSISKKVDQRIDDEKFKDIYENKVDEIVSAVANKIDASIEEILDEKEDRGQKYKVVTILSNYISDLIDIPQDQAQARERLARNVGVSSELITESTVENVKSDTVRLASADYLKKSNGEYKVDRAKLKELVESNIQAGAILYSKTNQ